MTVAVTKRNFIIKCGHAEEKDKCVIVKILIERGDKIYASYVS